MAQQTAFRKFHDLEKIVRVEIEADDAHRQTSDKLRFEPVLDKIFRGHVLKQFVVHYLHGLGPETDLSLTHAPGHLFLQFFKRAADHEQNVASVDRLPFCFAFALKLERRLQLRLQIVHAPHRHFRFFHQLEQRRLNAAAADIASNQISGGRYLVDLVNVNDPELRQVHVAVGFVHQLAHQIFHIAANVTGLAELRRVRFHERDLDQIGDVLDQIRFSDAGRSDQNHILFGVLELLRLLRIFFLELAQIFGMVVMITNRDREHLFRFVLLDHEPIQVRLDIARQKIELELLIIDLLRLLFRFGFSRFRRRESRDRDPITEVLFHELGDLRLQFLG